MGFETSLTTMPNSVMRWIEKIQQDFLWNDTTDKISSGEVEDGV